MPINDPTITATCDGCGIESEPMEMCALAGGGWDERYIENNLRREDWSVDGKRTLCFNCSSEDADGATK